MKWTEKEKEFVQNNLHLTDAELGKAVGRSALAVKEIRDRNDWYKRIVVAPAPPSPIQQLQDTCDSLLGNIDKLIHLHRF